MTRSIRQLLADEKPLLLPAAHDALSARLVEKAGFRAYGIGGFALAGVRLGLPDVGLMSFGEAAAGVRDVMMGTSLPVLVDAVYDKLFSTTPPNATLCCGNPATRVRFPKA